MSYQQRFLGPDTAGPGDAGRSVAPGRRTLTGELPPGRVREPLPLVESARAATVEPNAFPDMFAGILPGGNAEVSRGDPEVAASLGNEGAAAATLGGRMYFADADPAPEIVAHEAVHLVQQRRGGRTDDRATLEAEAEHVASALVRGDRASIEGVADTGTALHYPGRTSRGAFLHRTAGEHTPHVGDSAVEPHTCVDVDDREAPQHADGREWRLVHTAERSPRTGWMAAGFIDRDASCTPGTTTTPPAVTVVALPPHLARIDGSGVHRYAHPADTTTALDAVPAHSLVTVTGRAGTRLEIRYLDSISYIEERFVTATYDSPADVAATIELATAVVETHARPGSYSNDTQRANVGMGSWTGHRIGDLLASYERVARAHGVQEQLYGAFGGEANFRTIQADWSQHTEPRVMDQRHQDMIRRAARIGTATTDGPPDYLGNPTLRTSTVGAEAEHLQLDLDFESYVGLVGALTPRYPFLRDGRMREGALAVFASVAHQHGAIQDLYTIAWGRGHADEATLLTNLAEVVVERSGAAERDGVRARYRRLHDMFAASSRTYLVTGCTER